MNTEYTSPTEGKSFIPLTLLSLSLVVFFAWQLYATSKAKTNLSDAKQKQEENYQANNAKFDEVTTKFKVIQDGLQNVATGLLEISKGGDKDAQEIVKKWKIEQQQPNPAAPATH